MKILIATGIFPPDIGGPATYTKFLLSELPKRNFDAQIVAYGEKQPEDGKNIFRISRRWPKGLRHIFYFLKIFRLGSNADIIFAQDPVSSGLPAFLAAWLLRKKFLIKIVGDYAWEQGVQRFGVQELPDEFQKRRYGLLVEIIRSLQKFVSRKSDLVIVPSDYLKKIVLGWGVRSETVRIIYNGIDLPPLKSDFREKVIVSVGRLVPWKGFEVLMKVFFGLLKDFSDWKLIIIGAGPELDKLKAESKNMKTGDSVIFTGSLAKSELNDYLSRAGIFALNTGYEGFSHQIAEAMAFGLPVLTTQAGGNPEIIENNKNGLLLEYNDSQSWDLELRKLMADGRLRESLGDAAKNTAKNFTKERMLGELSDVLKKL